MDFLDEGAHRVLAYVKALNDGGYSPRRWEVDAYAKNWRRKTTMPYWTMPIVTQLGLGLSVMQGKEEKLTDYLDRLNCIWVHDDDDEGGEEVCDITDLGEALLPALERQEVVTDENEVVEVIAAGDEFALSRVMSRIGRAGPGAMLADPYLRSDDVLALAASTGVDRILVGERGKSRHDAIRAGVPALAVERVIEVRVAGRELHDRCLIPAEGPITVIGGSLNGAGSNITIVTQISDPEGAVRTSYEELWDSAEVLATSKAPVSLDSETGLDEEGTDVA